ncbi:MAG TPA: HEAT repeat domain-containing protein [Candidatus Wallbacteria bacterium]|nr:MAG: putative lyase [bacterium ADurb.Bin243]HPG58800.1 HEAT repeat domain-containing protein [Candidatus Wallbacteria bacterium]
MADFTLDDLISKNKLTQKNAIEYFSNNIGEEQLASLNKMFESNPKSEAGFIYAVVLGRNANKEAIDKMILYLQNKNYSIQKQAELSLIYIGKNAVEPLIKATAIDDSVLLMNIAKIIRNMKDTNVAFMLKMLESGTPPMKLIATHVLGKIKNDDKVMISLIKALANEDGELDKLIIESLVENGEKVIPLVQKVFKNCNDRITAILMEVLFRLGAPAYKLLTECLDSPTLSLRRHAPYALRFASDEATIKKIIDSLNDSDYYVCESACKFLIHNLKHASYIIIKKLSEFTISSMQKGTEPQLSENQIHWLIKALCSDFDSYSEHILIYMKNPEEVKQGQVAITNSLKLSLASAASEYMNPVIMSRLLKWLADENFFVRENSINLMITYGHNFVAELVTALGDPKEEVRAGIITVLQNIKDAAFGFLLENLKMGNNEMRYNCAYALGFMGDKSAIPQLKASLSDGNDWVREYAIISLGKLGEAEALVGMLARADEKTKSIISRALGYCGAEAFGILYDALMGAPIDRREPIAKAMMEMGPAIKDQLQKVLETEENENVRFWLIKVSRAFNKKPEL